MSKRVSFQFADKQDTKDATASFIEQTQRTVEPTPAEMRGKSAELLSISHKPRYCHIVTVIFFVGFLTVNLAFVASQLNQLKKLLEVKMDWNDKESIWLYQTLTGIKNVGGCIGSFTASFLLVYGRRKTLLIIWFVYIFSAVLEQFLGFWTLLSARLVAGMCNSIVYVAFNRFIEEYVPLALFPTASAANGVM